MPAMEGDTTDWCLDWDKMTLFCLSSESELPCKHVSFICFLSGMADVACAYSDNTEKTNPKTSADTGTLEPVVLVVGLRT